MREYDLATACRWIGNSPAVAARHYSMSIDLDADFRRAVGQGVGEAQQKAQQSASARREQAMSGGVTDRTRHPEKPGSGTYGHALASAVATGEWAIQDSNLNR